MRQKHNISVLVNDKYSLETLFSETIEGNADFLEGFKKALQSIYPDNSIVIIPIQDG